MVGINFFGTPCMYQKYKKRKDELGLICGWDSQINSENHSFHTISPHPHHFKWFYFEYLYNCNRTPNVLFIITDTVFPPDYRPDGRCGPDYPGPNGEEGICLPDGVSACCGTNGWCGNSLEHCTLYLYRDYRLPGKELNIDLMKLDSLSCHVFTARALV